MIKIKLVFIKNLYEGLQWRYENTKGEELSIICHKYSYGYDAGLFEVMASWENDVKGYLTFKEVQEYINELEEREFKLESDYN